MAVPTTQETQGLEFLEKLAGALAPLGQTSGELQDQLYACAAALHLQAEFLVLPTYVHMT